MSTRGVYAQLRLLRMLACCAELAASTHLASTGLPLLQPYSINKVVLLWSKSGTTLATNQNNNRQGAAFKVITTTAKNARPQHVASVY